MSKLNYKMIILSLLLISILIGITAISAADTSNSSSTSQNIVTTQLNVSSIQSNSQTVQENTSKINNKEKIQIKDNKINTKTNLTKVNNNAINVNEPEITKNKTVKENIKINTVTSTNINQNNTVLIDSTKKIVSTTNTNVNQTVTLEDQNLSSNTLKLASNNIVYVSQYGNDYSGTGTSSNPYRTIFKGLCKAPAGGTIKILSGTYTTLGVTGSVTLDKDATIIGTSNTIITLHNIYNSGFVVAKGHKITMSNIIFSNNAVNELLVNKGLLTLTNCRFYNNGVLARFASNGRSPIDNAGGTLNVNNCIFNGNSGYYHGGAIHSTYGKVNIKNSQFNNNEAMLFAADNQDYTSMGGAIFLKQTVGTISGCTFNSNVQEHFAVVNEGGTLTISGSTFKNHAQGTILNGNMLGKSSLTIINSKFINNWANMYLGTITIGSGSNNYLKISGSSFKDSISVVVE